MTLYIAAQDFAVQVAGADVEVKRGDFYDDTTAVYAEATSTPLAVPLFVPLPDGITTHRVATEGWEG